MHYSQIRVGDVLTHVVKGTDDGEIEIESIVTSVTKIKEPIVIDLLLDTRQINTALSDMSDAMIRMFSKDGDDDK